MKNSAKTKPRANTTKLPPLGLYNTLTKKIEPFIPLHPGEVLFYSCGPTVYDFPHIGNHRTNITNDLLKRTLLYAGFRVTHVMNVTDVGHLTGDNLGDADVGEDRIEQSSREQGKSAWEIAQFYTDAFLEDLGRLNILPPTKLVKATDHIKEMVDLVRRLEQKGLTYTIDDGVYFDTSKLSDYGKLSGQRSGRLAGARVEPVPGKKHPSDFALWKFTPPGEKRQMEWDSPWGRGFPGWHIECSAMSMKYLGETLDVHSGGEDHIAIHHENEIAQSEGATGKPFVRYWVHVRFLTVDGKRMGKSEGNAYTLQDVIEKGYDPLAFRYLVLQSHYRSRMDFTWQALEAARRALDGIRMIQQRDSHKKFEEKTRKAVEDAFYNDLGSPRAIALLHEAGSWAAWKHFDSILGLGLADQEVALTVRQKELIQVREKVRVEGDFAEADRIREELAKEGIDLEDTPEGPRIIQR